MPVPALAAPALAMPALAAPQAALPRLAAPQAAMPLLAQVDPCSTGTYQTWKYTLRVDQIYPSRMVVVKNALGDSVTMISAWTPPAAWPAFSSSWSGATIVPAAGTPVPEHAASAWTTLVAPVPAINSDYVSMQVDPTNFNPSDWPINGRVAVGRWKNPVNSDVGTITNVTANETSATITMKVDRVNRVATAFPKNIDALNSFSGKDYKVYVADPNKTLEENLDNNDLVFRVMSYHEYTWTGTWTGYVPDPHPPIPLYDVNGSQVPVTNSLDPSPPSVAAPLYNAPSNPRAIVGSGGVTQPPADVLGKTGKTVNWGLLVFPGLNGIDTVQQLEVPVDTRDTGVVDEIENRMHLAFDATTPGLNVGGRTPTRAALDFAKTVMQVTTDGGDVTDSQPVTVTLPQDLRGFNCKRFNGVVLITDGVSNDYNPNGQCPPASYPDLSNWADPCLACSNCAGPVANPGCPDGGPSDPSVIHCPDQYTLFPAGRSEELFNVTSNVFRDVSNQPARLDVRSWVIGLSQDVGPCELNYTAYMGRTDAHDPNGRAGLPDPNNPSDVDPRLPTATGDTTTYQTYAPTCPDHTPTGGDYAFFAQDRDAFITALGKIVTAIGHGDYTTSAPAVTGSAQTLGTIGLVASARYPDWKGHLYAYDLSADCSDAARWDCSLTTPCGWVENPADPNSRRSNCKWDAGQVLSTGPDGDPATTVDNNNGTARLLYSWNPANSNQLIRIQADSSTATALNGMCGGCLDDPTGNDPNEAVKVLDFILGNDGNGTPRRWELGAITNSTPAIVGATEIWKQNNFPSREGFEETYSGRHSVIWIGASDGLVHAIDYVDGVELLGLLPPDLLAKQRLLYENYRDHFDPADPSNDQWVTGEDPVAQNHLFGVANSLRFGDVWGPASASWPCLTGSGCYKTMLFVPEGPGGAALWGFDVTHPYPGRTIDTKAYPADPHYDSAVPVQPLWGITRSGQPAGTTQLATLGEAWSVPALGGSAYDSWELTFGAGWDGTLPATGITNEVFRVNPVDGTLREPAYTITSNDSGARVRNQTFSDSVILGTHSPIFKQDNVVDQSVQLDLNGRMWFLKKGASSWTLSQYLNLGAGNPMYYPPAVAAYPPTATDPSFNMYAFSTGTFYEESPNVTGPNVGDTNDSSAFVPALHIDVVDLAHNNSQCGASPISIPIRSILLPDGSGTLGRRTQVTAPPLILVPTRAVLKPDNTTNDSPFALYLLYDPDASCAGISYIVWVDFDPTSCTVTNLARFDAGEGAAAGFAIAGGKVILSKSHVGDTGRAELIEVPNLNISVGNQGSGVRWWMELQ
ncbi:MAG: hypothetical protein ACM3O7_05170 [Acidobacteriota bacterium]